MGAKAKKKRGKNQTKLEIAVTVLLLGFCPSVYYVSSKLNDHEFVRQRAWKIAFQSALFQFNPAQVRVLGEGLFLVKRSYWDSAKNRIRGNQDGTEFLSIDFSYSSVDIPIQLEAVQVYCNRTERCSDEFISMKFLNLVRP